MPTTGRQAMTDIMDRLERHTRARPVNVEAAIRDLGLTLAKNADLPDGIAGHIRRVDGDKFEIASTKKDHYYRQRFTMAHELGHYVLHRGLIGSGVDDDTKYRSTEKGDFYNSEIDEVHERQANAFAATLLIPEQLIRKYVAENPQATLKDTAVAFQVSPSAMRWRLKSLDIYSPRFDGQ